MRTFITVVVSVFLGVVAGVFVARAHFAPKLVQLAEEKEGIVRENERLTAELQFAAERLRFMESDFAALQKQLDTLSNRPEQAATQASMAAPSVQAPVEKPTEMASAETKQRDTAGGGSVSGPVASKAPPDVQVRIEQDRVRVQDFLQTQIETATDPAEQARLSKLQENMQRVRDLYDHLREAQTAEERQSIIKQVARTRAEMRDIIMEQRASLLRQTLEQSGVSDPTQQQHLIAAFEELQNSPYYTDQMLIWGMAPQPRTDQ